MTVVIALMMAKDEADIIEASVTNLLNQVDVVVVYDNGSTDGTKDILWNMDVADDQALLCLYEDDEVGYYQSDKMTKWAHHAAARYGFDDDVWIVPVDADEIWYSPFGTLKERLESVAPQYLTVPAYLYDHVASSEDDLSELDPTKRIGWRRKDHGALPKVACRWREDLVIQAGNHMASYNGGATVAPMEKFAVRHFPYRSPEQFVKKAKNGAAAYAATDLPPHTGQHWRDYGRFIADGGDEAGYEIFHTWFYEAAPYQTAEIRNIMFDPAPVMR